MSKLSIAKREIGDVVILDLEGQIRLGEGNINLHRMLRDLVELGRKKVLINLAQVSHIDSSGLGELVAGYTTFDKNDGVLKLLKLTERVKELMVMTKLLTVFEAYDSEQDAIESFQDANTETKSAAAGADGATPRTGSLL